jgi:hypothetical protein
MVRPDAGLTVTVICGAWRINCKVIILSLYACVFRRGFLLQTVALITCYLPRRRAVGGLTITGKTLSSLTGNNSLSKAQLLGKPGNINSLSELYGSSTNCPPSLR